MQDQISQVQWGYLADAVLCAHIAVVAFVVLGQVMIVAGGVAGTQWVRNLKFRLAHLLVIVFIAAQTLLGQLCPLTNLEHYFRVNAGQQTYAESFTQHWLTPLIFFDAPWWAFATLHSAAAILVIGSWWLVAPDWSQRPVRLASERDAHVT